MAASGNTISSGGISYSYDFENRMLTRGSVLILYDGDGNRVSETVAGVTTEYLVDTLNPTRLPQAVDEVVNGSVTRTYAYGLQRVSENQQISARGRRASTATTAMGTSASSPALQARSLTRTRSMPSVRRSPAVERPRIRTCTVASASTAA